MTGRAAGRIATWRRSPWPYTALLALPVVVALVAAREPVWFPTGDLAQAELHVRAVPTHMPLLGAAGRFGTIFEQGSHLGPAGAVALSVPYRLLGGSGWSLMAATAALHVAAIAGALVVCRRVAGAQAMGIVAVVIAVMVHSFGADWVLEPWNPWFGVFALLTVSMCAWGVWGGDHVLLVPFVVIGSFCAQVHVAYAPVVAGVGLALAARVVVSARRGDRPSRRVIAAAAGAGVLMWLPPLVDQLTRDPGNLTILWRHFQDPPDAPAGWTATLSTIVDEINLFGSWSTGPDAHPSAPLTVGDWFGFVALVLVVASAVAVARSRRDSDALRAWSVVGIVTTVSAATVTRIYGPVYDYLIRWLASVTALVVAVALWTLWRASSELRPRLGAVARPMAVVVTAGLIAATVAADVEQPLARDSGTLSALAPASRRATSDGEVYLVRFHDPVSLGALGIGMLLDLERAGRSVGADAWLSANVLPHRTMAEADADAIIWVVSGDAAISRTEGLPGAVTVARTDPRSPDEVALSDALRRSIEARLGDLGRSDLVARLDEQYGVSQVISDPSLPDDLVVDLEQYRALRLPAAVVLVPVGNPA